MILFLLPFLFGKAQPASGGDYKTAFEVFSALQKKYPGDKWYRHFIFSQETIFYNEDGKEEKTEIWHEVSSSPGKLLIKFGSKDSKNGVLIESGMVHVYREGKDPVHRPGVHDLSVAAFDVYFLKPERTVQILDSLGYNTGLVRKDELGGRSCIVIGAAKGDTLSKQIWYDAERLYVLRIVYRQGKTVTDALFNDYRQMKNEKGRNYWVATSMLFRQNGKLTLSEQYFDIRFPSSLHPDFFDPGKFNEVKLD